MFACDSAIQNMMFSPSNIEIYVFLLMDFSAANDGDIGYPWDAVG